MARAKTEERLAAEPIVERRIGDVGETLRDLADQCGVSYPVTRRIVLDLFYEGKVVRWKQGDRDRRGPSNVRYARREFAPYGVEGIVVEQHPLEEGEQG